MEEGRRMRKMKKTQMAEAKNELVAITLESTRKVHWALAEAVN